MSDNEITKKDLIRRNKVTLTKRFRAILSAKSEQKKFIDHAIAEYYKAEGHQAVKLAIEIMQLLDGKQVEPVTIDILSSLPDQRRNEMLDKFKFKSKEESKEDFTT